jgi:hypothetical protein
LKTNRSITIFIPFLLLCLCACGELRYSNVSPEARDFHPRRVAILPADTTAFPAAKGAMDRIFADVLKQQKWFADVVGGEAVARRMESDEAFKQVVSGYLTKLANVSYSDPVLSQKLGEMVGADAFMMVRVDYWNYTTLDNEKIAKVSLTVTMVESKTGKTVWTASHHKISGAKIIEPALSGIARSLVQEMVGYMPH